ncbi:hypothetical protein [Pelagibius marinus]|uniref:hypothetical protein n=1 Tax=Pelagibius marinus TaxID=2762760 RepID=UPI0018728742|nr:hypothetical protein [Pelagibius marinus]
MTKSLLLSSFAAATVAFTLAACDEQQATDSSTSVPMQQQGAMPSGESAATPAMPEAGEPQAMEPQAMEPMPTEPETVTPEGEEPATSQ